MPAEHLPSTHRPRIPAEGVPGSIWSLLRPDLHLPEIHCQQVNPLADVLEEWLCDEQRWAEGVCVYEAEWCDSEVHLLKESMSWHTWLGDLWQVTYFLQASITHL